MYLVHFHPIKIHKSDRIFRNRVYERKENVKDRFGKKSVRMIVKNMTTDFGEYQSTSRIGLEVVGPPAEARVSNGM